LASKDEVDQLFTQALINDPDLYAVKGVLIEHVIPKPRPKRKR
jgi:hypothetical protein